VIYTTPAFDLDSNKIFVREFLEKFQAEYGVRPEEAAAHAFDAMMILSKAIGERGLSPFAVARGILSIQNYPGVSGETTFEKDGGVVKDYFIKRIEGDRSILIERIKSSELRDR
jgi:branched-chain amino acid transport system substrate-binding protein